MLCSAAVQLRSSRWLLTLVLFALLALVVPARPSLAAPPQRININDTFVDPFLTDHCGFPVLAHTEGMLVVTDKGDVTTTRGANFRTTFTNLETGKSVVLRTSGVDIASFHFDENGSLDSFSFSGATRLISPGDGALYIDAGHTVQTFSFNPETGFSSDLVQHGRHDELFLEDAICAALAP